MKNKPNFFFDNRGFPNWGGGSAVWEFFPHNPVFFSDNVPKADVFEKNPLLHIPYFGPKWPFFGPEAQILAQKPKNIVLEAS